MVDEASRKHQKDMTLLVGSLVIVILLVGSVAFLIYHSTVNGNVVPEYGIAFFSSIATLIIGYTFGRDK